MNPMTRDELLALPAAVSLETAGRAFGIGRTKSHELARAGSFPVPVLTLGKTYRVPTAAILKLLGIDVAGADVGGGLGGNEPTLRNDVAHPSLIPKAD